MPKKPLKPCSKPGCSNLTRHQYCEEHVYLKKEYVKQYDSTRDKHSTAFYKSKEWLAVRDMVIIRDNGLCVQCLANGYITKGRVVDHVRPLKIDWELRLTLSNLQLLCQSCHQYKTAEDVRKYTQG